MIEQIKTFPGNVIAIEVIDGFTGTDQKMIEKLFQEKLKRGFDRINMLVKLDEMKISNSSIKAFMEDSIWAIRNYSYLGNFAIVAHSKIVKALVPIDRFFFERIQKGCEEKYFDVSQLDAAFQFIADEQVVSV
ncbi:MAG: STAS/SEC14 domain-containing protein [Saprospiraceae bacterium]|nr:STAS/SEC14 domain-containing protein [Saprospiraceae bacterium]